MIFIVDKKIQKKRFNHLKATARKKGLPISEIISDGVKYIVTDLDSVGHVEKAVNMKLSSPPPSDPSSPSAGEQGAEPRLSVVKTAWLCECISAGKILPIKQQHRIVAETKAESEVPAAAAPSKDPLHLYTPTPYACQSPTPLQHHNIVLTEALEFLEEYADLMGRPEDRSRALAFRKASCALKSLPRKVTAMSDLSTLTDVGKHSRQVVKEIIDYSYSSEVNTLKSGEFYKVVKVFTGVWGVGPATAKTWFSQGLRSLADVEQNKHNLKLDERQSIGLQYYTDLNEPVLRVEADIIQDVVKSIVADIDSQLTVEMMGGFRRGKPAGHDLDLLITHPTPGGEVGVLRAVIDGLKQKLLLAYVSLQNQKQGQTGTTELTHRKDGGSFDHFESCFCVFKLPKCYKSNNRTAGDTVTPGVSDSLPSGVRHRPGGSQHPGVGCRRVLVTGESDSDPGPPSKSAKLDECEGRGEVVGAEGEGEGEWVAKRVDIVVVPNHQYAYAVVGWTGSRHFNRQIRLYATKQLNMALSSHSLHNLTNGVLLPAETEEDVFKNLKLDYLHPTLRNC